MGTCASHSQHNHEKNRHRRLGRERMPHGKHRPKRAAVGVGSNGISHKAEEALTLADGNLSSQTVIARRESSSGAIQLQQQLDNHTGDDEIWFDSQACFASDPEDEFMTIDGNSLSLLQSGQESPRPTFAALKERTMTVDTGFSKILVDEPVSSSEKPASMVRVSTSETFVQNKLDFTILDVVDESQKLNDGEYTFKPRRQTTSEANFQPNAVAPVIDSSADLGEHQMDGDEGSIIGSCFPRLLSFNERKKPLSPKPRRKSLRRVSFKRRSSLNSNETSKLGDHREILERPLAGSQVPPLLDDKMERCWSVFSPSTFKLRAPNFSREKRKEHAPSLSVFEPVGADVFFSTKKINHVAKFVELPSDDMPVDSNKLCNLLVVNVQIPWYPASVFGSAGDGEGLNLVLYFKLSEKFKENPPAHLKEMLTKFLDDEVEKVKGLVGDSFLHFRERLKIVARVMNPDELHLTAPEKKLLVTYNEKPVLSRPQHVFYKGNNYLEIDLDVHRFSFLARKTVESFRERLKLCILDIGLVIQAGGVARVYAWLCEAQQN
ncbi:hypothetical protein O6H91_06G099900 [Diphasiastrum complanatum]|uniref:Uncharacterized protein n=1 Tax=Diphasiastrum complanatum TaxID=34168 RepID=A0ACC2DGU2_DIPCM|nr:hypothetical protein O6H91_06G099900 [Diphasiastrum complanatum]